MSKPHLSLPCKYSVNDFTPSGEGYHCTSCDKHLQDFRNLNSEELRQALSQANGKTCGVFNTSQLSARSSTIELGLQRQLGLSLLGILGFISPMALTSCNDGQPDKQSAQHRRAFNNLRFPLYLKGTLVDKDSGKAIPHAKIRLNQSNKTVLSGMTDKDGRFSIAINEGDLSNDNFELILQHQRYKADTLQLPGKRNTAQLRNLNLTLEASTADIDFQNSQIEGEVTFIAGEPMSSEGPAPGFVEPIVVDSPQKID